MKCTHFLSSFLCDSHDKPPPPCGHTAELWTAMTNSMVRFVASGLLDTDHRIVATCVRSQILVRPSTRLHFLTQSSLQSLGQTLFLICFGYGELTQIKTSKSVACHSRRPLVRGPLHLPVTHVNTPCGCVRQSTINQITRAMLNWESRSPMTDPMVTVQIDSTQAHCNQPSMHRIIVIDQSDCTCSIVNPRFVFV